MVVVDAATRENGCLEVAPGRHTEGIFPHESGVTSREVEEVWHLYLMLFSFLISFRLPLLFSYSLLPSPLLSILSLSSSPPLSSLLSPQAMDFSDVIVDTGDIVIFDSYLPHRSASNQTEGWRRLAYLTFNKASEGDLHAAYYDKKAQVMQKGAISINLDFAGKIVD